MTRKFGVISIAMLAMVSFANIVCQAQPQSLLTRHVREATFNGEAKSIGQLPASQSLRIDIVLSLRHQAELENFLRELYDPSSSSYRKFLSVPEFTARFGPSQEDWDALVSFAKASGFEVVGGTRDAFDLQLKGTVGAIQQAFHVTMRVYQHPTENRTFFAPDREPTVDLPFALWHITGLDNFSTPRPMFKHKDPGVKAELNVHSNATTGSCPSKSFCGSDMRAAYYAGTSLTGSGQNIGLLEYAGFDISDVNTYYTNAGQTRTFAVTGISTDGSSTSCTAAQGCDDTEQTLDITQAGGMAPGVTTVYVYVSDSSDTALLGAMSTDTPLPLQLSSSWTWTPADPSTDDPYFMKMATQGQSFFQAAGDSGKWTSSTFPSEDANVICVGGTDLTTASAGGPWKSESTWVDGGGGFYAPDDILIPSWQQLAGVITTANEGSTKYRNGPDVSANSNFTFYVCADQSGCTANEYGGTSFAAPMWAGYLALANQQAAADSVPAPGFINPTIYPLGLTSCYDTYFHDITSGSNGFPAVTGYDLATGWGSPNGAALINALTGTSCGGGGNNFTISASPTAVSVAQGGMGTSTITTAITGSFNSAIALSASGQPAGATVTFNPTSIAAPGNGSSTMTMAVAATTAVGTYPITVTGTGGGDTHTATVTLTVTASGFALSASPTAVTVAQGAMGTSTITSAITGAFDSAVALSATGQPAGVTVAFNPASIAAPGSGTSTMTMTVGAATAIGTYPITVTGSGGGDTATTTVTLTVISGKTTTTTTLTTSPNPSNANATVTMTATVTASDSTTPSGTVAFYSNGAVIGAVNVNASGVAVFYDSGLPVGTESIVAVYAGTRKYATSTSNTVSQMVNGVATTTVVTSSASGAITYGTAVTFTATVTATSGTPTGSVQFLNGSASLGTVALNSSGAATLKTSTLAAGTDSITARYLATGNFSVGTSAPVVQVVNQSGTATALTTSPNPSTSGQAVTMTATVTAANGETPTGTVRFYNGTTAIGGVNVNGSGVAVLNYSGLPTGTDSITATYVGNVDYSTSTSPAVSQVVN